MNTNATTAAALRVTIALGETVECGTVRVHRFAESFEVTDLTNAGKRGKRVRQATLATTYAFTGKVEAWMEGMARALACAESFDDVARLVADLGVDYPGELRFAVREARGVDVLPAGSREIRIEGSRGLRVTATAHEFRVRSTAWVSSPAGGAANDNGAGAFAHDTMIVSRDRKGAAAFHAWLREHQVAASRMDAAALCERLVALGATFDTF